MTTTAVSTNRRRPRFRTSHILLHAALIAGSLVMLLPFVWMFSTSLKSPPEIFKYPPVWIPSEIAWDNYARTVAAMPFGRFYLNSLIVTASVTTLQILVSSLAAFAFARLHFRGREALFLLYLATLMIPFQVTMIPNFILVRFLGWYDSYQALILPTAFSAFSTFLLRQYFMGIPRDLDEAARMDGASSFRIWWQVILPLSGPALAALAIFVSLNSWNDFLWPLIILTDQSNYTLPVALAALSREHVQDIEMMMAGAVITVAPVLILFLALQRYYIRGMLAGSVKG
jgi:multiple sugar transport system permease protein